MNRSDEKATHRCKICGAHWRLNPPCDVFPDGSWTWMPTSPGSPKTIGKCCDNAAMGDQIEKLHESK